jgi:nitroreductase
MEERNMAMENAEQTMDFFDLVKTRRSVRKFKPDPIPEEHVARMLDAARLAPTAGNRQPWKFLVIRDPTRIEQMKQACIPLRIKLYTDEKQYTPEEMKELRNKIEAYYEDFFSAPLYVAVLTDSNAPYAHYNVHDGALAAGYLCLAAHTLGYGTVYDRVYFRECDAGSVPHPRSFRTSVYRAGRHSRWFEGSAS